MFFCEMAGCFDTATNWVSFETKTNVFVICESCAEFWKKQSCQYPATVKPFLNEARSPVND
jgi:hypothetical protein